MQALILQVFSMVSEQLRPHAPRLFQRLLPAPGLNVFMMPGKKHLRHLHAAKIRRKKFQLRFQQSVEKRVESCGKHVEYKTQLINF